jgi:hypothetical protein
MLWYDMSHTHIDDFFQLIRLAIGTSAHFEGSLCTDELRQLFEMAKKQSLTSVCFEGIQKLSAEQFHDEDLTMELMGESVKIARRNKKLDQQVAIVTNKLEQSGFECCLLKGQGNALMYPNPSVRTPGDIDMWVRPKNHQSVDEDIKVVISFVRKHGKNSRALYHHIDGLSYDGTEVEMHYRPHFMQNLIHNARLQHYFQEHADDQFKHYVEIGGQQVAIPTDEFNIVFQLSHIYQHLFHEGIGLRQVLDYYFLLKQHALLADGSQVNWDALLGHLGLLHIASALMWILVEKFGMNKEWAIVVLDERRGRFVLKEILLGGNFGKYDERNAKFGHSALGKNVQRLSRDARLLRYFPTEALGEPIFRLYHAWWRIKYR